MCERSLPAAKSDALHGPICQRCLRATVLDPEQFSIEKIEFQDKDKKVVVRGKFDAEKLCKKVWCKAGKIVKEIVIAEVWPMPAAPKPCKPCKDETEHCKLPKPETSKPKPEPVKCDCDHCCGMPCKAKVEKCCECEYCKPKPADETPKTPPAPKTEYKLIPYLMPCSMVCPSWPWQCPPHQQCQGCQKPPVVAPPPSPPPCSCSNSAACGCRGARPVWPPQPPVRPPPPWGGYNIVTEENSCSVM